jgi:DNA polymerase-3 subunit delta'
MPWEIVGHQWATELLSQHIARGRVRHAYLFTGPMGIGRRTLALNLAQTLNCTQPDLPGEPCQSCSACKRIKTMKFPDLSIIQAEQVGGTLVVDQVRELQRTLSLSPYEARYRVAILQRFEEAHLSAANALLKTLEEPSPQVVIVLTAESAEGLLPTIVSRCEVLRLHPVSTDTIRRELQHRWQVPAEQAQLVAHLSGGRPGYAVQLTENNDMMEKRQEWLDDLFHILEANRVERFAFVERMIKRKGREEELTALQVREEVRNMLQIWLLLWRDIFLALTETQATFVNLDYQEQIGFLSKNLDLAICQHQIRVINQTLDLIDKNVNTRQALEVLMLDLPFLQDSFMLQ